MKKTFLFIVLFLLIASGCCTCPEPELTLMPLSFEEKPIGYEYYDGCNTHTYLGNGLWMSTTMWCGYIYNHDVFFFEEEELP